MLDYDREASRYDATRGGRQRAEAAANACLRLLGSQPPRGPVLDLACGTGSVTAALTRRLGATCVVGLDASAGMLGPAALRCPGRIVRADAARLPVATGSLAAVTAIWLLHLLPIGVVSAVVAEIGRCLAPGGRFLTTVDKNGTGQQDAPDAPSRIDGLTGDAGLQPVGSVRFVGHGQRNRHGAGEPGYRLAGYVAAGRQP